MICMNRRIMLMLPLLLVATIMASSYSIPRESSFPVTRKGMDQLQEKSSLSASLRADQKNRTVKGTVVDNTGEPLIGVSVLEVGTSNGAVTDVDGKFSLEVSSHSVLQFSYVGFVTQKVNVDQRDEYRIVMNSQDKALDEIVVVAFGKMKREAFTGSAGIMKGGDLGKVQVTNATQALAGRVAGVQLNNSSSQMGSSPSITIRGVGSISSDTQPLIVVDGMPFDGDLNTLNSNDIETMTVLKDAASNALYGARGANGVVMITTKQGTYGKTRINVDAKWGWNTNGLKNYKTLNAQQFYETYYKMLYNYYTSADYPGGAMSSQAANAQANSDLTNASSGNGPGYMVYTVPNSQSFIQLDGTMNPNATLGSLYTYGSTKLWLQPDDWEKEGLQTGARQEYNATISGATDKINYYTSLGYLNQDGIQRGSNEDRISARLKLSYQANKVLRLGANFDYARYKYSQTEEGTIGTGTIWSTIKTQAPIYPVYYRGTDHNILTDQWGEPMYDFARLYDLSRAGGVGGNCIFGNKYVENKNVVSDYTASGFADFYICEDLTFTLNAHAYNHDSRYSYIKSPFVDHYTDSSDNGYLSKSSSKIFSYNLQQLLNYNHLFGRHSISGLLGHEYYNYKYEYMGMSGRNFGIEGATEIDQLLNKDYPSSYSSRYNNEGYFFRGMYDYANTYYASLSFRRDASSRFNKNNRWGNFWSAGVAWVISKEEWFKTTWIDNLKLKFSVGSQGNDNIGNFLYTNTYNIVNNGNKVGYQWRGKGTENITWETNTNWNTGIEFEGLHHRINGSLDFFYRKTSDMLFSLGTPPTIGYTSRYVNLGDMRNMGVELVLNATPIRTKNLTWDVHFNISHVKNKVLNLPADVKTTTVEGYDGYVNHDASFAEKFWYFIGEGLSLYTWHMPKYAGVDGETGEALYYKNVLDSKGNVTGQETTKNWNEATDYLCGNAMPSWYGGIGTTLAAYGFDVSVNFTYQLGGKAYDYTYQTLMHTGGASATNWHEDILNVWSTDNKGSCIPRLMFSEKNSQNGRSDRFLESASYLNCQNLNMGYTLPKNLTQKAQIESARIYFSAENLFYLSARQGFDPRYTIAGYTNPELYSPMRTCSFGVQLVF